MAQPASATPPEDPFVRRLRAAKWLAKQGFGIVSVPTPTPGGCGCPPKSSTRKGGGECASPGKHPLGMDWEHHAAHTPEEVEALTKPSLQPLRQFGAFPEPGSRLLVLDEDRAGTLAAICAEHGITLPDTFMVLTSVDPTTGERKRHSYWRLPDGYDESSVPKTWTGGEIRVAGSGHVVAPWSKHASGVVYEATGVPGIATIPVELLVALAKTVGLRQKAQNEAREAGDPGWTINTGEGRHEFLVQRVVLLWKGGLRGDELVQMVLRLNKERNNPPYPASEIERLVREWADKRLTEPDLPFILNVPGTPGYGGSEQPRLRVVGVDEGDFVPEDGVPFPDDPSAAAFQGLAGRVVRDLADITTASRVGLLVTALTVWGGLYGDRFNLYESQPTNIFAVLVGDTARGRKGTATRAVWASFQDALDGSGPMSGATKIDGYNWGGLASGQGLLRLMSKAPAGIRRGVSIEEEFETVLRGARSTGDYNSILNTIINKAWDGNLIRHTTASETTSFIIEPPYSLGILGNITREVMRGLLPPELVSGGFANRVLFVPVRGRDGRGSPLAPMQLTSDVRDDLRESRDWRNDATRYKAPILTTPSEDLIQQYYEHLSEAVGAYAKFTPRLHVIATRIAFTHALLDRAVAVTPEYIDRGIALTEYCRSALAWNFSAETGDDRVDHLIDMLKMRPEGITARQFAQVFKDGGVQQRVRRLAIEAGLVEVVMGPSNPGKGGRPAHIMRLSPIVGASFGPRYRDPGVIAGNVEGIAGGFVGGFVTVSRAQPPGDPITPSTRHEAPAEGRNHHVQEGGAAAGTDEVGTVGIWGEDMTTNPPIPPNKPITNPVSTAKEPSTLLHKLVCLFYSEHQTIHLRHSCGAFHCEACSPTTEDCPDGA